MSDPYDEYEDAKRLAELRDRDTAALLARGADFRPGRWQDVASDIECDHSIFDAPFGERTHKGHDAGTKQRNQLLCSSAVELGYDFLTPRDVREIVAHWSPRTRGWICVMTSHDLVPHWEAAFKRAGRYWFAPVPVLEFYRPRLLGDGPGSRAVWLIVARPRSRAFLDQRWGSLPGDYRGPLPTDLLPAGHYERHDGDDRPERMGGKTLSVMRDIVRDYSRPGDLVCDMFAGECTTGRAALELGRRFVGCEKHPPTWAAGRARLLEPIVVELFAATAPAPEQFDMWPEKSNPGIVVGRSALLSLDGWAGQTSTTVLVIAETPERYRIAVDGEAPVKLAGRNRWLEPGKTALVPKAAVRFDEARSAVR